jgi:hypothetical protein
VPDHAFAAHRPHVQADAPSLESFASIAAVKIFVTDAIWKT